MLKIKKIVIFLIFHNYKNDNVNDLSKAFTMPFFYRLPLIQLKLNCSLGSQGGEMISKTRQNLKKILKANPGRVHNEEHHKKMKVNRNYILMSPH